MRRLAGGDKPLRSVALGPDGCVYASDGASVFVVDGGALASITNDAGGELRWLSGGLLVYDAKAPLLARVSGL